MTDFAMALMVVAGVALAMAGALVLGAVSAVSLLARAGLDLADLDDPDDEPEDECEGAPGPGDPWATVERPLRTWIRPEDIEVTTQPVVAPWWYGGRHRELDSRMRIPPYLGSPQATAELPVLGEVSG